MRIIRLSWRNQDKIKQVAYKIDVQSILDSIR